LARLLRDTEGVIGEPEVYGPYEGPSIAVAPALGALTTSARHGSARALIIRSATLQYISGHAVLDIPLH